MMNTAALKEEPVVFSCEGEDLIGVVHQGADGASIGMLCIVAGGPQYRGGCGRQLVELARAVAADGYPVMRFDHRGLGDGGGEFLGFEHLGADIHAAIEQFLLQVPSLEHVVLWGGCDAASAALINASVHPAIVSIVAANPWVSTSETAARVRKKHYLKRLGERSFWAKVLKLEYNPFDYIGPSSGRSRKSKNHNTLAPATSTSTKSQSVSLADSYVDRMLEGMDTFAGSVLLLMSGRSLISREFDELVASNAAWSKVCGRGSVSRIEVKDADQTFSTRESKNAMIEAGRQWLRKVEPRT